MISMDSTLMSSVGDNPHDGDAEREHLPASEKTLIAWLMLQKQG